MGITKEVPRRLAAIMFTDMVGYSALVHRNELLGLELLREHHDLVRQALREFSGREIDTAGDGFVVEFSSAVAALECALRIQERFSARNQTAAPDRRIQVRIGIHASDVFLTESAGKQGIYGDGVNLAARLQPLAPVGGICISRTVYDQVIGKVDCAIHFMGDTQLKGFDKPIRVYSVDLIAPDWRRRMSRRLKHNILSRRIAFTAPALLALAALAWWISRGPANVTPTSGRDRIAILPFEMIGADENGAYASDGLVNGLISALSQRGLRVLAKDSVIEIQKSRQRPMRIGEELRIGRLITGRILQEGLEFLVNVAIIDTATEEVEWSKDYRTHQKELVKTQSEITNDLRLRLMRYQVTSSSSHAPASAPPASDAYLAYIRGHYFLAKRTHEDLIKAGAEFENAIKIDPKYSAAHASLAMVTNLQIWYGIKTPREAELSIVRHASEALALDPSSIEALITLAEVKAYIHYDFDEAESLFRRAIAVNDRHVTAHQWYSELLMYLGRFTDAQREIGKALEYDPLSLVALAAQSMTSYYERNYDRAQKQLESSLNLEPNFVLTHYWLGRVHLAKRNFQSAIESLKKAAHLSSQGVTVKSTLAHALAVAGQRDEARTILRELERLPRSQSLSPYHFAVIHAGLGNKSETLRALESAVRDRASQAVSTLRDPRFDYLRDTKEFQEIIKLIRPDKP